VDGECAGSCAAVPEIKKRLLDAGCRVPIIEIFITTGTWLLIKYPECAKALDKYRINPGNVGAGQAARRTIFLRFAKWQWITASRCALA